MDSKRAEKLIEQTQAYARTILNSLSAHIAIIDENGRILETNQAWNEFAQFFQMARTSMKQLLDGSNRDYAYYDSRGWFDSDYYYPTRLSLLKRTLGALFDGVFSLIYRPTAPASSPSPPAREDRSEQPKSPLVSQNGH